MDNKTLKNSRTRRTTLTLEADVVDYVDHKLAVNKNLKEKNVINDLLRKGIRVDGSKSVKTFQIKPYRTKLASGMTVERLEEMIREI